MTISLDLACETAPFSFVPLHAFELNRATRFFHDTRPAGMTRKKRPSELHDACSFERDLASASEKRCEAPACPRPHAFSVPVTPVIPEISRAYAHILAFFSTDVKRRRSLYDEDSLDGEPHSESEGITLTRAIAEN